MSQAEFEVEICELSEEEWSKYGMNKIRFLARTNPGSKFGAINSIASGGELSRLFLSLKLALAKVKSIPTIIFDEIDVGVGGAVADSIGKKLSILAKQAQLLVITHQPQVACYSDHHYLVSKKISGNKVSIEVKLLTQKEKLNEVARMLSGAMITKESILAAETLINKVA
jgi:DNA repair protein RecN (Recombination protein N)